MNAASDNVVWVIVEGGAPYLYRSTDRGTTWQQRAIPPGNFPRAEVSFVDDLHGWFATGGVPETQCNGAGTSVWRTSDGGETWQQVASVDWQHQTPGSISYRQCKQGLSFVDTMHGFLGGADPNSGPTIYATADGGLTWAHSALPDPPGFTTQSGGFTLTSGLVRGFGKTLLLPASGMRVATQMPAEYVFRSVDGGATWSYLATTGVGLYDVIFVSESRWLKIVSYHSALETTDAGSTWHGFASDYEQAAPIPALFAFGSPLVGYGTVRGSIERTVDGGHHWTVITTPGT